MINSLLFLKEMKQKHIKYVFLKIQVHIIGLVEVYTPVASPFSVASLLSSVSPFSATVSSGASSLPFSSLPLLSGSAIFFAGDFFTGDSFSVEVTSSGAASLETFSGLLDG